MTVVTASTKINTQISRDGTVGLSHIDRSVANAPKANSSEDEQLPVVEKALCALSGFFWPFQVRQSAA
jgi:hypothetical protein